MVVQLRVAPPWGAGGALWVFEGLGEAHAAGEGGAEGRLIGERVEGVVRQGAQRVGADLAEAKFAALPFHCDSLA